MESAISATSRVSLRFAITMKIMKEYLNTMHREDGAKARIRIGPQIARSGMDQVESSFSTLSALWRVLPCTVGRTPCLSRSAHEQCWER